MSDILLHVTGAKRPEGVIQQMSANTFRYVESSSTTEPTHDHGVQQQWEGNGALLAYRRRMQHSAQRPQSPTSPTLGYSPARAYRTAVRNSPPRRREHDVDVLQTSTETESSDSSVDRDRPSLKAVRTEKLSVASPSWEPRTRPSPRHSPKMRPQSETTERRKGLELLSAASPSIHSSLCEAVLGTSREALLSTRGEGHVSIALLVTTLQRRIEKLEGRLEQEEGRCKSLATENDALRGDKARLLDQIASLRNVAQEVHTLNERVATRDEKILSLEHELRLLKVNIDTQKPKSNENVAALQALSVEYMHRTAALEKELIAAQEQLQTLRQQRPAVGNPPPDAVREDRYEPSDDDVLYSVRSLPQPSESTERPLAQQWLKKTNNEVAAKAFVNQLSDTVRSDPNLCLALGQLFVVDRKPNRSDEKPLHRNRFDDTIEDELTQSGAAFSMPLSKAFVSNDRTSATNHSTRMNEASTRMESDEVKSPQPCPPQRLREDAAKEPPSDTASATALRRLRPLLPQGLELGDQHMSTMPEWIEAATAEKPRRKPSTYYNSNSSSKMPTSHVLREPHPIVRENLKEDVQLLPFHPSTAMQPVVHSLALPVPTKDIEEGDKQSISPQLVSTVVSPVSSCDLGTPSTSREAIDDQTEKKKNIADGGATLQVSSDAVSSTVSNFTTLRLQHSLVNEGPMHVLAKAPRPEISPVDTTFSSQRLVAVIRSPTRHNDAESSMVTTPSPQRMAPSPSASRDPKSLERIDLLRRELFSLMSYRATLSPITSL